MHGVLDDEPRRGAHRNGRDDTGPSARRAQREAGNAEPAEVGGVDREVGALLWIANAIISVSFPVLIATVNIQGAFLVFFVLGLIAIFFLKKMLPETGNRSLGELEEAFAAGNFS
jgi:hypothetical protein